MSSGACQRRWPPRSSRPWARGASSGNSKKRLRPRRARKDTMRGPADVVTVSSSSRVASVRASAPWWREGWMVMKVSARVLALLAGLADQVEDHRAAVQPEFLHQARLQVAPVGLGQLFLAVAEDLDAKWPVAGLGGVVDPEPPAADRGGRR